MNHIFLKSSLLFALSLSVFGQVGDPANMDQKLLINLPVGTMMTIDGKNLSKTQSDCPNKNKVKYLIDGKDEVEVETADLLFSNGDVTCSGGTDLALIYKDLSGRYITFKGKVQDKTPLKCAVKEVVEFEGSIAVYLAKPCSLGVFFKRALLDFRDVRDLTIKSFQYNLGKHMTFSLDHTHKAPANISSQKNNKGIFPKSGDSSDQSTQAIGQ